MAYAGRAIQAPDPPATARPKGELIWGHATDANRAAALRQIVDRLAQQRPGVRLLLTSAPEVDLAGDMPLGCIHQVLGADTVVGADSFLNHWRPDICLWTGGDLRPALLSRADARSIPLFLLDAEEEQLARSGWRWFPDLPRSLMDMFAQIQVQNEDTARALRRIGVPDADIIVTSTLNPEAMPLPYDEREREDMANALRGHPLWMAADLHLQELDVILEARRAVSRLAHRSLLIIVPYDAADHAAMRARIEAEEVAYITWPDGDMPQDTTQIILTDGRDDLGLWYRLSPISFLGHSLRQGMQGCNPNEAAVHGTAILYGPNVRGFMAEYSRFAEARAARIVRDADTLAAAVQGLIAPDRAAAMIHAAWDVTSQGAEVTDRILDLLQDTLDLAEAG